MPLSGGVDSPGDARELAHAAVTRFLLRPRGSAGMWAGLFDPDPDAVGKSYTRCGGFLDDRRSDVSFSIAPSEALAMDPQQRLSAGVGKRWRAHPPRCGFADGVCPPGCLHGSWRGQGRAAPERYGPCSIAERGSGRGVCWAWQGPAVSVDTACSSSLVALHHGAAAPGE